MLQIFRRQLFLCIQPTDCHLSEREGGEGGEIEVGGKEGGRQTYQDTSPRKPQCSYLVIITLYTVHCTKLTLSAL